jgi:hypothetical protein
MLSTSQISSHPHERVVLYANRHVIGTRPEFHQPGLGDVLEADALDQKGVERGKLKERRAIGVEYRVVGIYGARRAVAVVATE